MRYAAEHKLNSEPLHRFSRRMEVSPMSAGVHTGRRALLTGWEVVTVIVAPHLEANVGVRIAPKVWPHGVGRKTDRIRISGARTGTATAIHPVRRSGMDRRDSDIMSRETRSLSDLSLGSVCAWRAQREHRSNCRD
jgi:hypothetical protein